MDKRKRTTDRTTVQPPAAKPAPTQAPNPSADFSHKLIRQYVLKVRVVAQLLEGITGNIYEYKNGLEEFAEQVEALSEALTERVERLEVVLGEEFARYVARGAEGGAR